MDKAVGQRGNGQIEGEHGEKYGVAQSQRDDTQGLVKALEMATVGFEKAFFGGIAGIVRFCRQQVVDRNPVVKNGRQCG